VPARLVSFSTSCAKPCRLGIRSCAAATQHGDAFVTISCRCRRPSHCRRVLSSQKHDAESKPIVHLPSRAKRSHTASAGNVLLGASRHASSLTGATLARCTASHQTSFPSPDDASAWVAPTIPVAARARSAQGPVLFVWGARVRGSGQPATMADAVKREVPALGPAIKRLQVRPGHKHAVIGLPASPSLVAVLQACSAKGRDRTSSACRHVLAGLTTCLCQHRSHATSVRTGLWYTVLSRV
jgi:hypothetical protein